MKKLLFVFAISLGFIATTNAQENEFAVKAGVNFSTINGDDVGDVDGRTGFHIGVLYHLGITETFAFQPELLYSLKGADDFELNYIDIPLLGHFHITEELTVHAGPQLSLLAGNGDNVNDDQIKSFDFGVAAGTTYRLESGLFFTARYNLGVSNIGEEIEIEIPTFDPTTGQTTTTT